ncbi:MAG TPA: 30S ribosomal protein S14 [Hyphomicrobium sp.]|nr:30S ribosomal protein S14 [Hyphomicrobium sp.]
MAKTSSIEKNKRRRKMAEQQAPKRKRLKELAKDMTKTAEERFAARLKLAELPRNGAAVRIRNRCEITGRARGNYRKLKMCRNQLRELASQGRIPGMVKSSW